MTEPTKDEVTAVLEKAHDALVEKGWTKYNLQDPQGRMCIAGAVNFAISGQGDAWNDRNPLYWGVINRLAEAHGLSPEYNNIGKEIRLVSWNNAPETTGDQVIALFAKAKQAA